MFAIWIVSGPVRAEPLSERGHVQSLRKYPRLHVSTWLYWGKLHGQYGEKYDKIFN